MMDYATSSGIHMGKPMRLTGRVSTSRGDWMRPPIVQEPCNRTLHGADGAEQAEAIVDSRITTDMRSIEHPPQVVCETMRVNAQMLEVVKVFVNAPHELRN